MNRSEIEELIAGDRLAPVILALLDRVEALEAPKPQQSPQPSPQLTQEA